MTRRPTPLNQCKEYLQALREFKMLWIVPTAALSLLAAGYALLKPTEWRASQAFVVRDEAAGGFGPQGRFHSSEQLKSFQETILESARNRESVVAALKSLGPPAGVKPTNWPTPDAIEKLQDAITVRAPRGGEFGKTEIIVLSVTGATPDAALRRTEAVYTQMESQLADIRNNKAKSLVTETTDKLNLAQHELEAAIARLEATERKVGSDLGELRILNDSGAGDSNLRSALNQLTTELRKATADLEAKQHMESMLLEANEDPETLLATSGRLFEAQPALKQLKEGLLNAQLRTAELLGKMTEAHPLVQSARDTEAEVRRDFHSELASALRGVRSDLEVTRQLVNSLQQQHDATAQRLNKLAELRARYGNLVADVRQRTELVEKAQAELAAARASLAGAGSASLISRFDTAVVGNSPVGPSRKAIVGAGFLSGFLTGLGLVFLAMPNGSGQGRRWTDYLGYGRRATDRQGGRRADDRLQQASSVDASRRATDRPQRRREADQPAGNRRADDRRQEVAVTEDFPFDPPQQAGQGNAEDEQQSEVPLAQEELPNESTGEVDQPGASLRSTPATPEKPARITVPVPTVTTGAKRSRLAACLSELDHS